MKVRKEKAAWKKKRKERVLRKIKYYARADGAGTQSLQSYEENCPPSELGVNRGQGGRASTRKRTGEMANPAGQGQHGSDSFGYATQSGKSPPHSATTKGGETCERQRRLKYGKNLDKGGDSGPSNSRKKTEAQHRPRVERTDPYRTWVEKKKMEDYDGEGRKKSRCACGTKTVSFKKKEDWNASIALRKRKGELPLYSLTNLTQMCTAQIDQFHNVSPKLKNLREKWYARERVPAAIPKKWGGQVRERQGGPGKP